MIELGPSIIAHPQLLLVLLVRHKMSLQLPGLYEAGFAVRTFVRLLPCKTRARFHHHKRSILLSMHTAFPHISKCFHCASFCASLRSRHEAHSQRRHLPVWIRTWRVTSAFVVNRLPQYSHSCARSPGNTTSRVSGRTHSARSARRKRRHCANWDFQQNQNANANATPGYMPP